MEKKTNEGPQCGCSTSLLKSIIMVLGLDPAPHYISPNLEYLHGVEPLSLINPCDGSGQRSVVAESRWLVISWAEERWVLLAAELSNSIGLK